jgi:hypothetical protein
MICSSIENRLVKVHDSNSRIISFHVTKTSLDIQVLIVGGRSDHAVLEQVEILDFNNNLGTCTPIANYPLLVDQPMVVTGPSFMPMVCGGTSPNGKCTDSCFSLTSNNTWENTTRMPSPICISSSSQDLNNTNLWYVAGSLSSTVAPAVGKFSSGNWSMSQLEQSPLKNFCMLEVVADTSFIIGGLINDGKH